MLHRGNGKRFLEAALPTTASSALLRMGGLMGRTFAGYRAMSLAEKVRGEECDLRPGRIVPPWLTATRRSY